MSAFVRQGLVQTLRPVAVGQPSGHEDVTPVQVEQPEQRHESIPVTARGEDKGRLHPLAVLTAKGSLRQPTQPTAHFVGSTNREVTRDPGDQPCRGLRHPTIVSATTG
jgi:hypothetical protein